MILLKNISSEDVVLEDLGMQLIHSNDFVELDESRKYQAANSSQLIVFISNNIIAVIDNDGTQVSVTVAIDIIKGFYQKIAQTVDNKMWVQSTARPFGTFTCFMSEGDRQDTHIGIGDGEKMMIHHLVGDPLEQVLYVDLNVKENKTFIKEGVSHWIGCDFDEMHFHITPKLTPYTAGTGTFFNLYGGFLIVPAAGDGTIQVDPAQIQLVEIPYSIDEPTKRQSAAFWDADYDEQAHSFKNLRPNIYAQGQYNIFAAEINLNTVCDFLLLGSNSISLRSSDVAEFGHGMRMKFVFTTNNTDHEWKCSIILTMSRTQTAES